MRDERLPKRIVRREECRGGIIGGVAGLDRTYKTHTVSINKAITAELLSHITR